MAKTILIIDDEPEIRGALRISLQHAGYDVLEAPSGRSALQICQAQHVDLVLTDILMPEQEGLETIRVLHDSDTSLKIIAMSGGGRTGMFDMLNVAMLFGAQSALVKPFTERELIDAVRAVLGPEIAPESEQESQARSE